MNLLRNYPRQLLLKGNSVYKNNLLIGRFVQDKFEHSDEFEKLLSSALTSVYYDPDLQSLAKYQKEGWMNINDKRVPAVYGRVNDPQDILGVVLIKDGIMVNGTFERMPTHLIYSRDGLVQLSDYLFEKIGWKS